MIKVFIPNIKWGTDTIGGGLSFIANLMSAEKDFEIVDKAVADPSEYDVMLIAGSTLVDKAVVDHAKEAGKKIVLRVDNFVRDSRNRGTGWSRLKKYYDMADHVVFQSKWAKDYVGQFLGNKKSSVILNGVNLDIFREDGEAYDDYPEKFIYLYSRHNRDETKGWYKAWKFFGEIHLDFDKDVRLLIAGQFEDALREYNFDFFNEEKYNYVGDIKDPYEMAKVYRSCDWIIYPYYYDACSNTLIESLCCGVNPIPVDVNDDDSFWEIKWAFQKYGRDYFSADRMAEDYSKVIKGVVS